MRSIILFSLFLLISFSSLSQFYVGSINGLHHYEEEDQSIKKIYTAVGGIQAIEIDSENNKILTHTDHQVFQMTDSGSVDSSYFSFSSYGYISSDILFIRNLDYRIYASYYGIIKSDVNYSEEIVNVKAGGVAMDTSMNLLFWTDMTTNKIMKSDLDGENIEEVYYLPSGIADLGDIEVDTDNQIIYWLNRGQGRVQKCKYDGTEFENLLVGQDLSTSLVFYEDNLFWFDPEKELIIQYAIGAQELDTIVESVKGGNMGVNYQTNTLYWLDFPSILKHDLTTNETKTVYTSCEFYDFAIDPIDERIYAVNFDNGCNVTMKIDGHFSDRFSDFTNNSFDNNITIDPVDEVFFVTGYQGIYKKGYHEQEWELIPLDEDNLNFSFMQIDITNKKLYFSVESKIYRINYDGSEKELVFENEANDYILSFFIDGINEKIYYSSGGFISRANLDGSGQEAIILGGSSELLYDYKTDRLFYQKDQGIYYTDSEGYYSTLLFDFSFSLNNFKSIDINSFNVIAIMESDLSINTDGSVELSWALDENFSGFVNSTTVLGTFFIERRVDNFEWGEIGAVEYTQGVTNYLYIDDSPESGKLEYRLKYRSDLGGLTSYSKIFEIDASTSIQDNDQANRKLWYNNISNEIHVHGYEGVVRIFNLQGSLIFNHLITSDSENFQFSGDNLGLYIAQINSSDGRVYSKSFFVAR